MAHKTAVLAELMKEGMQDKRDCVHIVSQGKGGVGKSLVSTLVAQYLASKSDSRQPKCFDTDPVNKTFAGFAALQVEKIEIARGNVIDERGFDQLVEGVCRQDGPFVVDTGATTFLNFWNYMVEGNVFQILAANQRDVVIHCVITGGQALRDTLLGLASIANHAPPRSVVVWLNEYFGPITTPDGKPFCELTVYLDNEGKMLGSVCIAERGRNTFGADVRVMLEERLTFAGAIEKGSLMTKERLRLVRDDVFGQLRALGI